MRVKIRRVTRIPARLLEVNAVRQNLTVEFGKQNVLAEFSPIRGLLEKRQLRSEIIKTERFAGQMRIRAVISRRIFFQMPAMKVKKFQGFLKNLRRKTCRILEK